PVVVTYYESAKEFISPDYIVNGETNDEVISNLARKMVETINTSYDFSYSNEKMRSMSFSHVADEYSKVF
ncbi:hypothetical protein M3P05_08705, partial [Sansalvadorimonas sp. 2012CJ34-2]